MDQDQIDLYKGERRASFVAMELVLPDATVRLCSGGFVRFGVDGTERLFDSESEDFGTLGSVDTVRDGAEASVVSSRITLHPRQNGLGSLTAEGAQRSPVRVWEGMVSADSGLVEGEPELIFALELDYCDTPRGRNSGSVILECSSQEYLQQVQNDQIKLNDAWLRYVWGNDAQGLRYVNGIATRKVYWRTESPRGAISYGGGSGGGPGGGGPNDNVSRL